MSTICKECQRCKVLEDNDIWYNYLCSAEAFGRQSVVCSVTGRKGYAAANSLNMAYISDDSEPYCRDVNTGTCEHFVTKT